MRFIFFVLNFEINFYLSFGIGSCQYFVVHSFKDSDPFQPPQLLVKWFQFFLKGQLSICSKSP